MHFPLRSSIFAARLFAFGVLFFVVQASSAAAEEAQAAKLTTIYQFKGGTDGGNPVSGLVIGPGGSIYGATASQVSTAESTIFRLTKNPSTGVWHETPIYSTVLAGIGANSLVGTPDALYAVGPGKACPPFQRLCGSVISLTPPPKGKTAWTLTTLYEFKGGKDGFLPVGGLVVAPGGVIYGTTVNGGSTTCDGGAGCGTVFKLAKSGNKWVETILHRFQGGKDGKLPFAGPSLDAAGNIYVSTEEGGDPNAATSKPALAKSCGGDGTYIEFLPDAGAEISMFDALCDAYGPKFANAVMLLLHENVPLLPNADQRDRQAAAAANIAFITSLGGGNANACPALDDNGCGVVATLTRPASGQTPWALKILHKFSGPDGALPAGALTAVGSNAIYGVARTYGNACTNVGYGFGGCGTIYKLVNGTTGWAWGGTVYKFPGAPGGTNPVPQLLYHGGLILGMTTYGGLTNCGNPGCGTIFALTP
jgi:hypothetical protein